MQPSITSIVYYIVKNSGIFLLSSFLLFSQRSESQSGLPPQITTISVLLNGLESITFNCYNVEDGVFTEDLIFKNSSKREVVIKKKFVLTKPTVFTSGNVVVSQNGGVIKYFKNILLFPGDSVILKKTDTLPVITYRNLHNKDLNSLLTIPNDVDLKNKINDLSKGLNSKSADYGKNLIVRINNQYRKNEQQIKQKLITGLIDSIYFKYLHYYNYTLKCNQIANITFNPNNFMQLLIDSSILDSSYKEIEQNFAVTQFVSSETPLFALINYNAFKQNKLTNDFWDYFYLVDKKIFESEYYRKQIFHAICLFAKNKENDTTQLKNILYKVRSKGITNLPLDSVYNSMVKARTFSLDTLNKQKYLLISDKTDTINYFTLLQSVKGKMVLIDFWASWCRPCRMQIPYLKRIKPKFNSNDIVFISVSIDDDEQHEDWLKANRDEGLSEEKYSYRLLNGKSNYLLQKYDITSVPRYVLYDRSGNIANFSFVTPNDPRFLDNLKKAISKNEK